MRTRGWAIGLGISVALNLFFAGWFGARAFQHRELGAERPGYAAAGPGARRFRQGRRPLEWMSDGERAEVRPRRKALTHARQEAEAAMRAEPFDPERLRQALAVLRTETDAIQASVHEYMVRRASVMSRDDREHLADMQWGPEHGPRRGPESGLDTAPGRGSERPVNGGR